MLLFTFCATWMLTFFDVLEMQKLEIYHSPSLKLILNWKERQKRSVHLPHIAIQASYRLDILLVCLCISLSCSAVKQSSIAHQSSAVMSSAVVLKYISSYFLIPLPDCSVICTVLTKSHSDPSFWTLQSLLHTCIHTHSYAECSTG